MKIRFQDRHGVLNDEAVGAPVVEVVISFDPLHGSGPRQVCFDRKVVALIDTGAEMNCIDHSVLLEHKMRREGQTMVYGVNSAQMEGHHVGHLFFS